MHVDRVRAALRPVIAARVFVISDQLLLLSINGDHRLIGRLEGYRLLVDMLELAVTVGMMAAFLGLAVDLPTVFQLDQQLGDAAGADLVPHRAQSCRKLGVALRHPQQRPRRITHRCRLDQPAQILQQRRVQSRQRRSPAARAPNRSFGKSRRGQIFQPAANRTRRNPGRTRHRGNAAVTRRPSLHRCKQAPASLIKACKQGLVACANRILVDHPVTIHSPQTTGNPLHFAADAPRFVNSWASPNFDVHFHVHLHGCS